MWAWDTVLLPICGCCRVIACCVVFSFVCFCAFTISCTFLKRRWDNFGPARMPSFRNVRKPAKPSMRSTAGANVASVSWQFRTESLNDGVRSQKKHRKKKKNIAIEEFSMETHWHPFTSMISRTSKTWQTARPPRILSALVSWKLLRQGAVPLAYGHCYAYAAGTGALVNIFGCLDPTAAVGVCIRLSRSKVLHDCPSNTDSTQQNKPIEFNWDTKIKNQKDISTRSNVNLGLINHGLFNLEVKFWP